ncbi:ABATE domain-containing protein, partial [Streptomyces carpinensis]
MRHVFPCGTPALDFVGTLHARRAPTPIERIGTPGLLDSWFVESGLLDRKPGSDQADLRAATALREAIYALVGARLAGRSLPSGAVAAVN